MTGSFILDYCILVFLVSGGVFQTAAALGSYWGLLYFQQRPVSFLFGVVVLTGAVAWFFLSESRNVPDSTHGLNGNEQFGYFFAGAGAGLAFTLIVSSLRNWSLGAKQPHLPPGLDALRETSYLRALHRTCNHYWARRGRVTRAGPIGGLAGASEDRSKPDGGRAPGYRFVRRVAARARRAGALRRWKRSWS
ncbi:MAG: hypothetical protein QF659_05730 [Dehalococcoidia bacterium]|nr:hypothetical protein [Dehalococcoidia bacterium]